MFRRVSTVLLIAFAMLPGYAAEKPAFQTPGPVHLDKGGEKWAQKSLKKMSLEQKVGQMFMVWSHAQFLNVASPEYIALRDTMRKYHLGGFGLTVDYVDGLLYKNEPLEAAMVTNQLQKDSEFPLLFAADFERGLGMRLNEVTGFPHAMAFGAAGTVEFARQSGRITAMEARALGVQWNWFPDVDVNSNPDNPVINTRSYGEDPSLVGRMAAAYIEGAHEFGMLTTAKHFPGHGDTDVDSHLAVPVIAADRTRLDAVELPPFEAAISAGVDAVLVAHVCVPALDPDPKHVASISPPIVTGLLRDQLGFHGLVITDALEMAGLMKLFSQAGPAASGQAAVEAVKAGNDMLLIPADIDSAYSGVLNAVRSGEISESRIDQSVLKVLRVKASVGLNKARLVDLDAVNQIIAKPENLLTAQKIADRAITLVRDNRQVLPLQCSAKGTNPAASAYQSTEDTRGRDLVLIFSDDSRSESGRLLDAEVRQRIPDARVIYLDPRTAVGLTTPVMSAVDMAQKIIVAIYEVPVSGKVVRGKPGDNSMAVQSASATLLENVLQAAAAKTVVASMGSPYIVSQFPEIQTYLCAYSNMKVSEISAVKAMFGEIPLTGRLPVTIPNIAARGAGVIAPAQRTGGSQ
jgi:beta-N-acetylhexosaminidase